MSSIKYFYVLAVIAAAAQLSSATFQRRDECLAGVNHKSRPGPEPYLRACRTYRNSACCTPQFTRQLAASPITKVGDTNWNLCGQLSARCERHMVATECFYRCSPNIVHWASPNYPAATVRVPICASDCDAWFDACKDDFTCAENWLTDWNFTKSGEKQCKGPCKTFAETYKDGRGLCQKMWALSLDYSTDSNRCMKLKWDGRQGNPNNDAVQRIFQSTGYFRSVMDSIYGLFGA
ncbi:riboflavin-binding protein [Lingula anatina]|uniref:Riboflavin-binding protein n=1 Tax=Lingula anatina TaxID=7574 RepID=A0A1S3JMB2_LINAN|nr:riboflavin-binding protein [Lingula anatina]|eukprot:XP_013411266.1 riboflavin-binding protein [Lingula anatina]